MIPLPERFKKLIYGLYGQDGISWLKNLPQLRESLLQRWSLQDSRPVDPLSYNYLEFAHNPEYGPVVLKIGFPNPELNAEIKALVYYRQQDSVVRLLDWDIDQGALLLERILPGYNLTHLPDEREAARIAANMMLALRRPPPEGSEFPTMEKWCQGFNRYRERFDEESGLIPGSIFNHACGIVRELLVSTEEQYFLHGDLHHNNLLYREDGSWVAIDPKGVIGEFAFEVGPYLYNPIPDLILSPTLEQVINCRLNILEEFTGLDRHRMAAWSFCRAILAAIWSAEEGDRDLSYWVKIAEVLKKFVN